MEDLEDRVVTAGDECGKEDSGARGGTSAADHAPTLPVAGLAGVGGDPDQACDFAAGEIAEFRQFGQDRTRQLVAHPWERDQQVLLFAPHRRAADQSADVAVDLRPVLLEPFDVTPNTSAPG